MFSRARHGILMIQDKYAAETKSLVNSHQVDLVEVCPRRKRSEVERLEGSYLGIGNDKTTDLSRPAGFRRAMMMLKESKPRRVVFSQPRDCSRIRIDGAFPNNNPKVEQSEQSRKTQKILKNNVLLAAS